MDKSMDDLRREFAASSKESAAWWTRQAAWHAKRGETVRYYDCLEMAATMAADWAKWQRRLAES